MLRPILAPPDDYIGKMVASKYRVEQMIGEGGMGKVYKATQLALDKPVVLKVLRQALLGDERTVARFQREAKAASRLNHPNSISVLDFGQAEDGAMFIAMEYVQGKDLHQILSREWPLPEARIIRIMGQVLSALADAHSAGVIHRDLKPENIMVEQRRNESDFVKVLDFGIAKIVDGTDDEGPALTRAGFVCGTPEYMSPEQARGAKLDHRSDLYAVGVILYQLTSGMLPFDSDSAVGFATKHLTEVPLPPSKRRPDAKISASMERLIVKSLAKNPDDRPQTAEQFRAELQAIEKERRAAVSTVRRNIATAAPVAAPKSETTRMVTPGDQETRVSGPPSSPWAQNDETVRSAPPAKFGGPMPQAGAMGSAVTATERGEKTTTKRTSGAGAMVFKAVTILLVALALGLVGAYIFQLVNQQKEVFVPPAGSLAELQVIPAKKRPADSGRLAIEGDEAVLRGNTEFALQRYLEAWQSDTNPELALKIGELYFQQDKLAEATAWWKRFRKDAPGSKALTYIDEVLKKK